jgi:hypothetical protein
MERFRILQVGDVHFSPERLSRSEVDLKDRQFSAPVAVMTTRKPLEASVRLIVEVVSDNPVDGIMFVGDLADRGSVENYKACTAYLIESLDLGKILPLDRILCVPGNHDIPTINIPPQGDRSIEQVWEKFAPLDEIWKSSNLPVIATNEIRVSKITKGNAEIEIFALNSCIGCGEFRDLPESIKAAIQQERAGKKSEDEDYWKFLEQLDTPGFHSDHLDETTGKISLSPDNKVSLILAHHNLLPQSLTRIAPYTELTNGGYFRTVLGKSKSPVVYCHGHIHRDPIEVVGCPTLQPPRLTTVSAPLLEEGFNIIEVIFSDDGTALGLYVQQFRLSQADAFSKTPTRTVRIPFRTSADYHKIADHNRSTLLQVLPAFSRYHASQILEDSQISALGLDSDQLSELLLELEWHGIVTIENSQSPFRFWRILYMGS